MTRYETLQIIFSALTFSAAVVVACIYGCQLSEMTKSTKAARDAAKAAKDSVILGRDNARLDQRAWVATTGVSASTEVGQRVVTSVTIKNSGKTFAQEVRITAHRRALPRGEEPDFNLAPSAGTKSVGLMAPETEYASVGIGETDIDEEGLKRVKTGEYRVFVFGKITYKDVFKCQHWTTFCWVLNPANPEPKNWTWEAYETGNDADANECL